MDGEEYNKKFQYINERTQGRIQEGGRTRLTPSLKLGKKRIFWRKIVIFHTKYPKTFRVSLRNWKKYDFLA